MRRRQFIGLVGGILAAPINALAQQPRKIPRIGYLALGTLAASATRVEALRGGLSSLGHVDGQNIFIEFRGAKNADELRGVADQLVAENVDIIFVSSSTETDAASRATKTIPIVFASHADPIATGHVASLARPGGNITGLSVVQSELTGKALEVLKEVVPHAKLFGVLSSPTAPSHAPTMRAAEAAAERLGVALHMVLVRTVEEYEEAFAQLAAANVQTVFVGGYALTVRGRPELLAQLALQYRLPSMFGARDNVVAGGLMSHSADLVGQHRRAATYIDKILKGAKPADLPVEQASQYQLVINLKTAKTLGITIPPAVLGRADEVIE
jgi:putative ABC transport system substrate-binding protein